jgi:hypothetical protein
MRSNFELQKLWFSNLAGCLREEMEKHTMIITSGYGIFDMFKLFMDGRTWGECSELSALLPKPTAFVYLTEKPRSNVTEVSKSKALAKQMEDESHIFFAHHQRWDGSSEFSADNRVGVCTMTPNYAMSFTAQIRWIVSHFAFQIGQLA